MSLVLQLIKIYSTPLSLKEMQIKTTNENLCFICQIGKHQKVDAILIKVYETQTCVYA